jgi:hypothetical protein
MNYELIFSLSIIRTTMQKGGLIFKKSPLHGVHYSPQVPYGTPYGGVPGTAIENLEQPWASPLAATKKFV